MADDDGKTVDDGKGRDTTGEVESIVFEADESVSVVRGSFVDLGGTVAEGGSCITEDDVSGTISMAQTRPPSHEYPSGQHFSPHFGSSASNAVVLSFESGWIKGSCRLMSHRMGSIDSHELPFGQQRTVVFRATNAHIASREQQKLLGIPS